MFFNRRQTKDLMWKYNRKEAREKERHQLGHQGEFEVQYTNNTSIVDQNRKCCTNYTDSRYHQKSDRANLQHKTFLVPCIITFLPLP